jgi:hypothetical protein
MTSMKGNYLYYPAEMESKEINREEKWWIEPTSGHMGTGAAYV